MMKLRGSKKNLTLKKQTIATLDNNAMGKVVGGETMAPTEDFVLCPDRHSRNQCVVEVEP